MTSIVCVSGVDLLMDYLEGVTPPEVREALDAHVAGCQKCQAFITSYTATPAIVRDLTAASLPHALAESLVASLRAKGIVS